jgi:hypothetical protein
MTGDIMKWIFRSGRWQLVFHGIGLVTVSQIGSEWYYWLRLAQERSPPYSTLRDAQEAGIRALIESIERAPGLDPREWMG